MGGGAVSIDSSAGGARLVERLTVAYARIEGAARRTSWRLASILPVG